MDFVTELQSDQSQDKQGGSCKDINRDPFMEEQHAPEDGKDYHRALDDGHHIKGNQQNGAGV